ncbi:MAG: protein translocase subunit SecF, partial [Gammaproteobacteria bacterium]|nr:protein translocase subunit SecF [Gammaproteobacteria bacterium]
MQLFKKPTSIDFMAKRKLAMAISLLLILMSIGSLAVQSLNFGIDFTGGSILEVGYPQAVELKEIRTALDEAGFDGAVAQHFGTAKDVLVRLAPRDDISNEALSDKAFEVLIAANDEVQLRRQEFVGPQVGDELTEDGG